MISLTKNIESKETLFRPWSVRSILLLSALLVLAAVLKTNYHHAYIETEPLAPFQYGDSIVYLDEAELLFDKREEKPFYKPPAYTILVHLLGANSPEGLQNLRIIQMILNLFVLTITFMMARARKGDLAGAIAFLLLLFYAPLTFQETKLLDTTLALFLLLASCFAFDRLLRNNDTFFALIVGLLLGLASISRAANIVLVLAVLGILVYKNRFKESLAVLCASMMIILPVSVHNIISCGEFIPINYSEGHTFLVGNNPNSMGIYNLPPGYPDGVLNERLIEKQIARMALGKQPSPSEQRDFSYSEGIRYLKEAPERIPKLLFAKLRFAMSSYETPDNYSLTREKDRFQLLKPFVVPFLALLLLGIFGAVVSRFRPISPIITPIVVTFSLLLIFYVTSRYRLALAPFLSILAGTGVASLVEKKPRFSKLRLALGLFITALISIFMIFTDTAYTDKELRQAENSFDVVLDLHAASCAFNSNDHLTAASILAESIAIHPGESVLKRSFCDFLMRLTHDSRIDAAKAARDAAPGCEQIESLLQQLLLK